MNNDDNLYNRDDEYQEGHLAYRRTPIEKESPEEYGYEKIHYNLAESSVPDVVYGDLELDLKNITLSYSDHLGNPQLRQSIAEEGEGFTPENVLITTGAAGALFIVATSLLRPSDHAVLLHPNYVANIETPRAIRCQIDYLRLVYENKFKLDLEKLSQLIKPNTKVISLTYPQNPTGTVLTENELSEVVSLTESKGCTLIVDETYRDMTKNPPSIAASLSPNVISVSSFSKAYGLPGIRSGWLLTQNARFMERFLAAKELIFICNSIIDEAIATHFYINKKPQFLENIQGHVKANFESLKDWMDRNPYLEWIEPQGGCISFPRIKTDVEVDIDKFYFLLKEKYKTFVAPGRWFEVDRRFMRIGFGYPSNQELSAGLQCITNALKESLSS
ncbi:MAG: aminotransferase class I/II-fold pyridoxal phosphate-dependent enzyme [Candidatus Hodarchaeales archaeon]|jgi:aspartate/methionine/tyrosine aminotransferase